MIHTNVAVRAATDSDLEALNEIYNRYATEAHYTFDIEPMTMEARREWFGHYADTGPHRVMVALSDQIVIGYASSGRLRPKVGYNTSVETSIYLAPGVVGRGVGSRLYQKLFKALEGQDLHRAYAGIALPNPASIWLHERFGFKRVAHFTEQGWKFGRYWDVAWYEKPLGAESAEPAPAE